MELIELKYTEETDKYHLFTITVKTRSFWGKEKTVVLYAFKIMIYENKNKWKIKIT